MITKFILKNYIPLMTKGVSYVELTLKDVINILLGKNGHGKTRILAELNEFPPSNQDYDKDGYKYVECTHNNKHYVLESFTGKSSKHSFKCLEGKEYVEHNPGGTQKVQTELVKRFFGLTPSINAALSALRENDRFTAMSPLQRKDILMELCPNDTNYALTTYNKMKQALNDTIGVS